MQEHSAHKKTARSFGSWLEWFQRGIDSLGGLAFGYLATLAI
jgi:hypothetical protein